MQKTNACAITGHRFASLPFGSNESAPECRALKDAVRQEFISLIECENVEDFLCGMALGADQICAEILIGLKSVYPHIKLHAYIPCAEQYFRWNKAQYARFCAILKHTESITRISETYSSGCMQKRNRAMVDHADFLLAVYTPGKRGGTAYTVAYAKKKGKKILVLDPTKIQSRK